MTEFTFPFPDGYGIPHKTVTLIQQTGRMELQAKAKVKKATDGGDFADFVNELIRASILKLDDKLVQQPFEAYDDMLSIERSLIQEAWLKVNASPKELSESFLQQMKITV